MEGKKRPTFDQEWWENIQNYLKENPEEGFNPQEVKQFIKYVVNKYMNSESNAVTFGELKDLIEEVNLE